MSKSRKNTVMKTLSKNAGKTLPALDKGLKTVGVATKNVATASIPVIEKGVSAVYGTMATGLDLGIKGVKSVTTGMSKRKRSRSLAGGRRTTKRRRTRRYKKY